MMMLVMVVKDHPVIWGERDDGNNCDDDDGNDDDSDDAGDDDDNDDAGDGSEWPPYSLGFEG